MPLDGHPESRQVCYEMLRAVTNIGWPPWKRGGKRRNERRNARKMLANPERIEDGESSPEIISTTIQDPFRMPAIGVWLAAKRSPVRARYPPLKNILLFK